MRLISWNVENAFRCLPSLPTIAEENGRPQVLCLQELRIRERDEQAVDALKQGLPGYHCHYSLPRDPRNVTFRGGRMYGVATFVRGHWHAQVPDLDLGRELRKEGAVIMVGDWNVTRTAQDTHPRLRTEEPHARARAEFNARMVAEGFVDIWRERHPTERAHTWFNRRARGLDAARADYVLVSSDFAFRIGAVRILDVLPWSDHAPVAVEY